MPSLIASGRTVLISEEDVEAVCQFKWYAGAATTPGQFYVFRTDRSRGRNRNRKIYLHRFILDAPSGTEVDHINHDPTDNRRENLRIATRSLNNANSHFRPAKSGFRGVHKNKMGWRAVITVGGRTLLFPRFKTAEEAARAYDYYAIEHFGEFAVLNFPGERHLRNSPPESYPYSFYRGRHIP